MFTKLQRYIIKCNSCNKVTDVMAKDDDQAVVKMEEKKWKTVWYKNVNHQFFPIILCPGCLKVLSAKNN